MSDKKREAKIRDLADKYARQVILNNRLRHGHLGSPGAVGMTFHKPSFCKGVDFVLREMNDKS